MYAPPLPQCFRASCSMCMAAFYFFKSGHLLQSMCLLSLGMLGGTLGLWCVGSVHDALAFLCGHSGFKNDIGMSALMQKLSVIC